MNIINSNKIVRGFAKEMDISCILAHNATLHFHGLLGKMIENIKLLELRKNFTIYSGFVDLFVMTSTF